MSKPLPLNLSSQDTLWAPEFREVLARYYFFVAEDLMYRNKKKQSSVFYAESYQLSPNPVAASHVLASKMNNTQVDKEALLTEAFKLTLLYPNMPEIHYVYANLLLRQNFLNAAQKALERAIDTNIRIPDAYIQLIKIYKHSRFEKKAFKTAEKLTTAMPMYALGWFLLTTLHFQKHQYKQALHGARKAVYLQKKNPEYLVLLAYLLELNKNSREAIIYYEKIYKLNIFSTKIIKRMLNIYRSSGGLQNALNLLEDLSRRKQGDKPSIHLQKAFIYLELNKVQKASEIFTNLAKKYPTRAVLQFLAGITHEALNHPEIALSFFDRIPKSNKFRGDSLLKKAGILSQKKDKYRLYPVLIEILEKKQKNIEIYIRISRIYAHYKDYQLANETLEKALIYFPESIEILFLKAVYLEKLQDISQCIKYMYKILELNPKHAQAMNFIGYLLADKEENLIEARQLIEKALKIEPKNGYYLDSLGWVSFKEGKYQQALKQLEKALKYKPNEPIIYEHMGDIYRKIENNKKSKIFYKKSINLYKKLKDKKNVEKIKLKLQSF